jgi:hypothetical protein
LSRSTLIVVAALLLVAALASLQPWRSDEPAPTVAPAALPVPPPAAAIPAPQPVVPARRVSQPNVPTGDVRLRGREDLAALLTARGLDPDQSIAALQAWRESRGFFGPDALNLTGLAPGNTRSDYYTSLDLATLRALADSGDLGAVQAVADRSLADDPLAAIDGYRRAAGLGSAAAMLAISSTLRSLAQFPTGEGQMEERLAAQLRQLRGSEPDRDLRTDALAWSLAAVRQYGPAVADRGTLAWVEATASALPPDTVTRACGQSLAIMADLAARGAPGADLPPVFSAEANVYERLPCRDTPAPVSPPADISRCEPTAARDQFGQPVAVWTCRGN